MEGITRRTGIAAAAVVALAGGSLVAAPGVSAAPAAPTADSSAPAAAGADIRSSEIEAGDCFSLGAATIKRGKGFGSDDTVPCSRPHDLEAADVLVVPRRIAKHGYNSTPVRSWVITTCSARTVPAYLGDKIPTLDFTPTAFLSQRAKWRRGKHEALCGGVSLPDLTGSPLVTTKPVRKLPELRRICGDLQGRAADCEPGALQLRRNLQVFRNAWSKPYPGRSAIRKRAERLAAASFDGLDYVVVGQWSKAAWRKGYGQLATVWVVLPEG